MNRCMKHNCTMIIYLKDKKQGFLENGTQKTNLIGCHIQKHSVLFRQVDWELLIVLVYLANDVESDFQF